MSQPKLEITGTARKGDRVSALNWHNPGIDLFDKPGSEPLAYYPPVWGTDVEWVLTARPLGEMGPTDTMVTWKVAE